MTIEQHSDEVKTGCANSVRAPTWDIQRRRDRLFTDLYRQKNGWETLTLLWRSRAADPWPFFVCHFTRVVLRAQIREEQQDSQEEIEYREKRSSQVNLEVQLDLGEDVLRVEQDTGNCFILCYQYWWTKDDHGPTARDLSLVFQLFSETSIHLDSWLSVMHILSQCLFAAHPTKPLICCHSMVAHQLHHVSIDCLFDQNQHLITTRNGYLEGTPTLTFVCCSHGYYLIM